MNNFDGLQYNTQREQLRIPEYGRHIMKMIDFAITIKDKQERNIAAKAIVSVMSQVNSEKKDSEDFEQALWDHLHILSNYQLDVESPYPLPKPENFNEKPERVPYPTKDIKYGYYGKAVKLFIKKAVEMEEGDEKDAFVNSIANLMKKSFLIWNRDAVEEEVIVNHIKEISNGKLELKDPSVLKSPEQLMIFNKKKKNNNNNSSNNKQNNKVRKHNIKHKKRY
ncbi:MAG: DUF4290 domain-containing protein [Flavobacteriales bacterium]|nr:DUF4290 domain-containing protein [Flavobacteriales bacterium]